MHGKGGGGLIYSFFFPLFRFSFHPRARPRLILSSLLLEFILSPIERTMPLEQLLSLSFLSPSIEGRAIVANPVNDRYPRLVRRRWFLLGNFSLDFESVHDSVFDFVTIFPINCSRIEGRECRTLEKRYDYIQYMNNSFRVFAD